MGHHRLATPDLGRIFRGETVAGLSEWQLLERYLECRDEAAFEALVARHGPMVLGVCRRMLADRTDVEDAFQATFLVLVRRARQLGPRDAIGPWLYGVAIRVAMRARSEAARRRRFQPLTAEVAALALDRSTDSREIGEILDQELSRLPSKYRNPIVLCYLEGQTHEEAARQLKWPIGTVKGRLARARDLLQSRLVRHGLAPAVGTLSLAMSPDSSAALHRELLDRTVKSSLKLALGHTTAQIASTSITSLVEGVLTSMFLNTLKWAGATVLVCGLAFTGVGVMARQDGKAKNEDAPSAPNLVLDYALPKKPTAIPSENVAAANSDAKHELAGLHRLLRKAAAAEWEQAYKEYVRTNIDLDGAYQASKRLMEAEQEFPSAPDVRSGAVKDHLQRIRDLARAQHGNAPLSEVAAAQVRAYAAEAEVWVARAEAGGAEKGKEASTGQGHVEGRGNDARSQQVLSKLDEPLSMSFNEETPLEDVLKYIKQATTTKTYAGIPIYVDPIGLQEAEKSMTSTVRNMDLEGVPLRRTLQLLLKQLDLMYFVDDGILCITSAESEDAWARFGPAIAEPPPILQRAKKAKRGELSLSDTKEVLELLKTQEQIRKLEAGEAENGQNVAQSNKEREEARQERESMKQVLKEMRDLMQVLKAEKPTKSAEEGK
jgi:RNA polymerase sigma factor (sigma-70 family)